LYVNAQVPLHFTFDHKGEEYRYRVLETINPIEDDDPNDPVGNIIRESALLNYQQITGYFAYMDLTQPSTVDSPGRGLYSYKISINLPDGTTTVDTITALGDVLVSEDTHPIVVEGFAVQDGYTDRFVIEWDSAPNRTYVLYQSTDNQNWDPVATYNDPPSEDEDLPATPRTETLTGYSHSETFYFAMEPIRVLTVNSNKKGQRVYLPEAQTLGVPELVPATGYSYSTITAAWKEAQKADTYRVKYRYVGESNWTTAETLSYSELPPPDVTGTLRYSFKPSGYNNVTRSGKAIEIAVDALNEELRGKLAAGSPEIFTTSTGNVQTRLVGPAELAAEASKAEAADKIELSWNKVDGAGGYYVFRRQFNMDDTAEERDAIVYYVSANNTVTGKDMIKIGADEIIDDTATVKAEASLSASRYTLTDEYMSDGEYGGGYGSHIQTYRDQQNELAWGGAYRYFIVPVLSNEPLSSIEFAYDKDYNNKNTEIISYTLQDNDETISYSTAVADLERTGFTYGFGLEVTASKGTKSETGQVEITWKAPPLLAGAGFTPEYVVFRRQNARSESDTWRPVSDGITSLSFTDTPQNRGKACDYAVGIYPTGEDPNAVLLPTSARFIRIAKERYRDEKDRPKLIGFTLASVAMIQVSRSQKDEEGRELKDSQGNFGEKVEWYAGGIDGADSYKGSLYDNNWGIDGYEVYVMNRNIDREWHLIAEIATLPNNTNQNVVVYNVQGGNPQEGGLLKVLRDYKHFFKVRSYVFDEQGERVRCPDPPYGYQWRVDTQSNLMETDYVKWGARQITADEFIKIFSVYAADGIQQVNGNAWNTGYWGRSANANGTGTSGSIEASSNGGVTSWDLQYNNYKTDLQIKTGEWITFITISGTLWAGTGAVNQYPQRYGDRGYISITGPADTPALYTGRLKIGNPGDLYWSDNNGRVYLYYPNDTALQTISYKGEWTALPYSGRGDERYQQEEWR